MAALPLPAMFTGGLIFPKVTHVVGQDGAWNRVGKSRTIHLGDGGTVTETVVEWTEGTSFAYELTRFSDVFDRFVVGVRGEWSVAPDGDGSLLRWTWEFAPRRFRGPLLRLAIAPLWRLYAQRIMQTSVRDAMRMPLPADTDATA